MQSRVHYRHTLQRKSEPRAADFSLRLAGLQHSQGKGEMVEFPRIKRLPPYVFNITGELKAAARKRGEDVIDFGMGNPDQPTPKHILDKLIETAQRGDTHGYSVSKGILRLRKAICNWYRTRFDVELDPEREAIATIFGRLDRSTCARCQARIFEECATLPPPETP